MWPFRKKVRQRRVEVRKGLSAAAGSTWYRFRRGGGVGSIVLAVLFFVVTLLLDTSPPAPLPYRKGQYVPADIYARVTVQLLSEEALQELIRREKDLTPATFRLNASLIDEILSDLKSLPERAKATTQPADLDSSLRKRFGLNRLEDLKPWRRYTDPKLREKYTSQLAQMQRELAKTYIVDGKDVRGRGWRILLAGAGQPKPVGIADLIPLEENKRIAQEATRLAGVFDKELRSGVKGYLLAVFARGAPLYRYDAAATETDMENAVAAIRAHPPREAYKHYPAGELLVQRTSLRAGGPFQGLSAAELELLRDEHETYLRFEREKKPWLPWTRILGRAGILLVVSVLLCLYVAHFQRRILTNHWRGFAVVGLLLLMLGANKVMSDVLNLNPHTAVLPVLMAAIIFAIAYDQGFAITLGLILSILVVLQLRMDSALFVVLVGALTIGVFQLHEIRSRSKVIVAAAVTGGVVFAAIWAAAMFRSVPWDFALLDGLWGLGATLLGGLLIQAALPLIERIFRIATSMTLLEWCDASKPLLKRLAMEAPGTYNHSLQLGAMCEVAAETIGARGLLARVGAYYHDVGKINKPEYFVENQSSAPSKHAKLSPAMSLLVIIGHVKDGLEMARRYALPPVLREFIAAHHGTTLVQYFYKAATEQRKTDTQRAPEEAEFRYPGPKPRSKEVAILMLADAAESSVRAITEPTPGRIENQVHTMVNRRLMDGQLDECDLTLKEVHQIEGSLTKSLCGIYHARIAYPPPTGEKPTPAEIPTGETPRTTS